MKPIMIQQEAYSQQQDANLQLISRSVKQTIQVSKLLESQKITFRVILSNA